MTAVAAKDRTSPPAGAVVHAEGSAIATAETLPPAPQIDAIQDELAKALALLVAMERLQTDTAMTGVTANRERQKTAQRDRDAALAKAQREAGKGGISKWLTKDIGLLGVVGLATFNYGLVAADIGLHKSGLVDNLRIDVADGVAAWAFQAHPELLVADILLRKLAIAPDEVKAELDKVGLGTSVPGVGDEDVKPIVDKAVQLNLLIAGAAVTVFSAGSATALAVALVGVALSIGAFASQEAGGPLWLTIGLQVAGCALTAGAGLESGAGAALNADTAARVAAARVASAGVNGVNGAVTGTDTVLSAVHQKSADGATVDATAAKQALARLERLLDDLIDALKESKDSERRATKTIADALQIHNDTLITATTMRA